MDMFSEFNKKLILITTPPRSGTFFLFYLLNDYFPDHYDLSVVFSKHNSSFLKINNNYIYNIVTIRDPIDMIASIIYYSDNDIKNKITSEDKIIDQTEKMLNGFYDNFFYSSNNILISFDSLINDTKNVLKIISEETGFKYNKNYTVDLEKIKKMDILKYDKNKYNFPREVDTNRILEIKSKIMSNKKITKIIIDYKSFINKCAKMGAKGIY